MIKVKSPMRLARMSKGLSLKEASSILGISQSYLSDMETGNQPISRYRLQDIKELYNLD